MRFRNLVRTGLALVAAVALGGLATATPAAAASISGLSVALGATNSANVFDDLPTTSRLGQSAVSVVSSTSTSFTTRYAMVVGTDIGNAATLSYSHTANYTITFSVNANVGQAWTVSLATSRVGAITLVDDGNGSASVSLGAATGTQSGAGTLTGTLGLAAVPTVTTGTGNNTPFNQTSAATITGVGTGAAQTITLSFNWVASSTSTRAGNNGDEGAVRMGIDTAMSSYTADNYPGVGARTIANDGHFVTATLTVPEPGTLVLMTASLAGLAILGRPRRKRPAAGAA